MSKNRTDEDFERIADLLSRAMVNLNRGGVQPPPSHELYNRPELARSYGELLLLEMERLHERND